MAFFFRRLKKRPIKPTANPYPSRFQRLRRKLSLGIGTIIAVIFLTFVHVYRPVRTAIFSFAFDGLVWSYQVVSVPFKVARTFLFDLVSLPELRNTLNQTLIENSKLKGEITQLSYLARENQTLKGLLHIPSDLPSTIITARVLATPHDGFHNSFIVSAGANEKVEKGMPVWVGEGVVGRIGPVGRHVARLVLLTDASFRLPVISEKGEKAILAGDGSENPLLVFVNNPRIFQKGERLYTSGTGGVFPPGIFVGIILANKNGIIRVDPAVRFNELKFIHISAVGIRYDKEIDQLLGK